MPTRRRRSSRPSRRPFRRPTSRTSSPTPPSTTKPPGSTDARAPTARARRRASANVAAPGCRATSSARSREQCGAGMPRYLAPAADIERERTGRATAGSGKRERLLLRLRRRLASLARLDEAVGEAVARTALLAGRARGRVPVARVGRVAQHLALGVELEARGEDLLLHRLLVDAMDRLDVAQTTALLGAVVDDAVHPARLERREHGGVHLRAVDLQPHEVVIVEDADHRVEVLGVGRERLLRRLLDRPGV